MKYFLFGIYIILGLIIIGFIYNLLQNKKRPKKIPSNKPFSSHTPRKGVQVDVLQKGDGKEAISGKVVRVHYTAWLPNGTVVDSSYDKGEIFSFTMGRRQVIPGWEAGMLGMKEGEKRKFTIAPEHAYGDKGKADVPPNSTIIFEVELLKVI